MGRGFTAADSDYLALSAAPLGATPTTFTVACWFYKNDVGSYQTIFSHSDTNVANLAALSVTGGNTVEVRSRSSASTVDTATAGTVTADTWHHVAGVWDGIASRTAYYNGSAGTEDTNSHTLSGHDQSAIARTGSVYNGDHWDGRVAELGIWDVALTAAEIAGLANAVPPPLIRPQSLVVYAPLRSNEDIDWKGAVTLTPSSG